MCYHGSLYNRLTACTACTTQPITVVMATAAKVKQSHKTLTIGKKLGTTRQTGSVYVVRHVP